MCLSARFDRHGCVVPLNPPPPQFLSFLVCFTGWYCYVRHCFRQVTTASATLYGLLSSTDAFLTLLTVKFHASMSDKYGRRPFLALSALGLGLGFYLTYHSRKVIEQ